MPADSSACPACGEAVPGRARFCPSCGQGLLEDEDETVVELPPPAGTAPAPAVAREEPHLFGITPPLVLLVLAVVALAVGVGLVVAGRVLPGALLAAAAVPLLAAFVAVARRKPDSNLARASARAAERLTARAGAAAVGVAAGAAARRDLARLRQELDRIAAERRRRLLALGEAVYGGDEGAARSLEAELQELDGTTAEKEAEMARIVAEAAERANRARLAAQPTVAVELPDEPVVPEPAQVPEPYPPPGELEPPEPPRQPEPYPPPDEGTPPTPPPIPEPYPPGESPQPPQR